MIKMCFRWIFFCILIVKVRSWDQEQLDVFDVVEEVNQNFYQLMNISQDADSSQIKRAFRSLSLVLHPDKNSAPDAEVQFRNLVSVYDVLKDPNKRKHYDDVLVNGLPNWRSAMYYYRHYRKMGLMEMSIILFILVTIGQYLIGWASYFEKKYTFEVNQAKIEKKKKKLTKKGQTTDEIDDFIQFNLQKPSFLNTLPFQIPRLVYYSIIGLPSVFTHIKQLKEDAELQKKLLAEQERLQKELEIEIEQKKIRDKALRKRKGGFKLQERDDDELPPPPTGSDGAEEAPKITRAPPISGGLWTDDDLSELATLVKKFPGGTTDRWEKIADQMNRSVHEVTFMAAKLKENCYRLPSENNTIVPELPEIPKKQKTRGGKTGDGASETDKSEWTQVQQKALESALAKYPKGPADRWDKIAKCVPNKTKEECMLRYKYLVEMLKKKKEEDQKAAESSTETATTTTTTDQTEPTEINQ